MATMFKHFNPHTTPSSMKVPVSLPVAPTMQAIIVDRVSIVSPQLASVIRNNAESIRGFSEDSHITCPTHREVITSRKTGPSSACVPIIHHMTPTSHVWPATM
jgi:hypothetical protein